MGSLCLCMKPGGSMHCQTESFACNYRCNGNGEKICVFMTEPPLSQSEAIMKDIEFLLDILQENSAAAATAATNLQTNIPQ